MDHSTIETLPKNKLSFLKLFTSSVGIAFLIIGIGLTITLALASYHFVSQPEQISNLMDFVKAQENLFAKWATSGNLNSIELSNTFSLVIFVIALCMVLRVVIGFINMCISSGKSLLNLSRNFD